MIQPNKTLKGTDMLEGIKVIELATYIAAPGAAGILADWGAEVIKVEPLSGCPMRYTMANMGADHLKGSPIFDLDNRGKKGIARSEEHTSELQSLMRISYAGFF